MKSKNIILEIKNGLNLSIKQLGEIWNIPQASLFRYVNEVNDISFNLMKNIMDELCLDLVGRKISNKNGDIFFLVNRMNALHPKYSEILSICLNICENSIRNKILPQFIPSKYIIDQHWRAFYCALREHLEINISNSIIPHIDNEILKEKWIPLQKLYNFQKEFNKVFLKYNILIPLGELQWV